MRLRAGKGSKGTVPALVGALVGCLIAAVVAVPYIARASGYIALSLPRDTAPVHALLLSPGDAASGGAPAVYVREGDGFFADEAGAVRVDGEAAVEVPTCGDLAFGGYYTEPDAGGTRVIDGSGHLDPDADPDAFASDGTLYGAWDGPAAAGAAPDGVVARVRGKALRSIGALALGSVYTVTLDGHSPTTPGTTTVYLRYGTGLFLDPEATSRQVTATANAVTPPTREATLGGERTGSNYEFGGYWTGANGTGTQVIDGTGHLADGAPSTFADGDAVLYARWYADAKYMDADGYTVRATQKVPLDVPTDPLGIDQVGYSKKPPEDCGWEFDCYTDFEHYVKVRDLGHESRWIETGETGDKEVYTGYLTTEIPRRYYAATGDKITISEETELDAEWRRTIHCRYYADGLSDLVKEDRFPQGYCFGKLVDLTFESSHWGDQTVKYWQRYTTSSFPPQHLYDDAEIAHGWEFQGWSCYRTGETPESKRVVVSSSADRWPWVYLPSSGRTRFINVTCWDTTPADLGNFWYGVYRRDVPVSYNANGGSGAIPSSKFEQSITCKAPCSTRPYGIVGGSSSAAALYYSSWSRPGYTYRGLIYDDPAAWTFDDDPTGSTLYQLGQAVPDGLGSTSTWTRDAAGWAMYAAWERNTSTVTLERNGMVGLSERGVASISYKQDVGYYRDAFCHEKMSPGNNPVKVPEPLESATFLGYFTQKNGEGTCYIDAKGYLTEAASTTAFPDGGTLYEAWEVTHAVYDRSDHTVTLLRSREYADQFGVTLYDRTVHDTNGVAYTGDLYAHINIRSMPFMALSREISAVQVAPDQTVGLDNPASMFMYCSNLTRTSGFDRIDVSRANSLSAMFYGCSSLSEPPDTSTWHAPQATTASSMFCYCNSMTEAPDVSNLGMDACSDLSSMFNQCLSMTTAPDMHLWDTSKVTSTREMFYNCRAMSATPNTSGWDLGGCKTAEGMFYFCQKMPLAPDTSSWGMESCANMSSLFRQCDEMVTAPLTGSWDTSSCTDMSCMFFGCYAMTAAPATRGWDTSGVEDMKYMFAQCHHMPSPPDTSSWDTSRVANMRAMFHEDRSIPFAPDVSSWDTGECASTSYMFSGCEAMANVPDVSGWDTSSLGEAYYMFFHCESIVAPPDVSQWDTSSLRVVDDMFNSCTSMERAPDVSGWDTSSLVAAASMFMACHAMADGPDMSGWSTGSLASVQYMFYECRNMAESPKMFAWRHLASDGPTGGVDLNSVFSYCFKLREIDLSGWSVDGIRSAYATFADCRALEVLDIPGLDTSGVESMECMFTNCLELKKVTLGEKFVFNDSTSDRYPTKFKPYLPNPASGYWVNSSHAGSHVVTTQQLHDGYVGSGSDDSYNAGTYCAALNVTYNNDTARLAQEWMPWGVSRPIMASSGLTGLPSLPAGVGWGFHGWATSNDTDETAYSDCESVAFEEATDLYCVYSRPVYFTHYAARDAVSPTTEEGVQLYRTSEARPADVPAMVASDYGWEPASWYQASTASPSSGDLSPASLTASPAAKVAIPVGSDSRWLFGAYTRDVAVSYDGHRNTGGATAPSTLGQDFIAGFAQSGKPAGTLAANGFEKTDCEFAGWALGSVDGDVYGEGADVPDGRAFGSEQAWATDAPAFTMYALWNATNITFTTPTQIPFMVLADGAVVSPSAGAAAIGNGSAFDLDVVGVKASEENGIDIVEDVTGANEMAVTVQAQGHAAQNVHDLVSASWKAVSWHIAQGGSLGLTFTGDDVVKIDSLGSDGAVFGKMEFLVEADV